MAATTDVDLSIPAPRASRGRRLETAAGAGRAEPDRGEVEAAGVLVRVVANALAARLQATLRDHQDASLVVVSAAAASAGARGAAGASIRMDVELQLSKSGRSIGDAARIFDAFGESRFVGHVVPSSMPLHVRIVDSDGLVLRDYRSETSAPSPSVSQPRS